jgi:hypothetical protein
VEWSRTATVLLLAVVLGWACVASAQTPVRPELKSIPVNVTVTHLSNRKGEGGVDERARALQSQLRDQGMNFAHMEVIEQRRLDLRVDEVGTVPLPDGSTARFSPLHSDDDGVLMAVDVEGSVRMDVRVRKQGRVVIGGPRYRDGKLAITIETGD